jgi:hypothetical protein
VSESLEDILKGIIDSLAAFDRDQKLKIEANELKNAVGGDDDAPVLHITEREPDSSTPRICFRCGLDVTNSPPSTRPPTRFCTGFPLPGYDPK